MNLLPGVLESGIFRREGLCVELNSEQLSAIGGRREITLGIRPEDIAFSVTSKPGWTAARVWVTEDLGNETLIRLSLGEAFITLRAPAGTRADFDSPAWFHIQADRGLLFDSRTTEAILQKSYVPPP